MKPTHSNLSSIRRRPGAGFTLIELMVATTLGTLVLASVVMLTIFSARSFAAMGNYIDLDRKSRNAVDALTREIRNSSGLLNYGGNYLQLTNATAGTISTIIYTNNTLVLSKTGQGSITYLTHCDQWSYALYSRAPDTNDFTTNIDFYAATNAESCKLINMNWKCSRAILGFKLDTETVETSETVMRNKVF